MELIIHDLDNEKLENLKWEIEKKEKGTIFRVEKKLRRQ